MYNASGAFVGMRLRGKNGKKWSVKGGKEGIFAGSGWHRDPYCIVEGPTDLAALWMLGFDGIARPNCSGAVDIICEYCTEHKIVPIIIADADDNNVGQKGALELQEFIAGSSVMMLPAKDMREYVKLGGSRQLLLDSMKDRK